MSYRSIFNLYANQTILLFRECYALEKIEGTSAHITWHRSSSGGAPGVVHLSSGAMPGAAFISLFDKTALVDRFGAMGHEKVIVFGEAYGGNLNRQAWRYGEAYRFVVFEVKVGDVWLNVPNAADVALKLGLEFVHYVKVPTDLAALDAERDAPSVQAKRNGVDGDKPREGVVLRPLIEVRLNNGDRVICKHKRHAERETATPREVVDLSKLQVLADAEAIAFEWVTEGRLAHVLPKLGSGLTVRDTGRVISAMVDDVLVEGEKEIVDSREARTAIGTRTAKLFKAHLDAEASERAEETAER
jgi:hypothetical protein